LERTAQDYASYQVVAQLTRWWLRL